jgi:excisionase family DNA binding protein
LDTRKVLSAIEVAEWLGISRNSVYEAVHRGEIPSLRLGRRIVVPRAALERMLQECGESMDARDRERGVG